MSYYYLILFLAFIIPIIFSFHPLIRFNRKFNIILRSIPLSSVPFIIWDIYFTDNGVWGFNKEFVSNIYLLSLPLEEVLFFFVVPFCCLYTYHVIERYDFSFFRIRKWSTINDIIILALIVLSVSNISNMYTAFCFLFCSFIMLLERKTDVRISFNHYYTLFIFIMIPFTLVNGALTGLFFNQTVVWYNNAETLGIRILTIPIEDTVYAHALILLNIIIYKNLKET